MKKVFSDMHECAHVYAQFSQQEGRCGNVSFEGDTFYSYNWYPIAHRSDIKIKDKQVIFYRQSGYSPSTSKHESCVFGAIDTNKYYAVCSYKEDPTKATLSSVSKTLLKLINEEKERITRARKRFSPIYYNQLCVKLAIISNNHNNDWLNDRADEINRIIKEKQEKQDIREYEDWLKSKSMFFVKLNALNRVGLTIELRKLFSIRSNKNINYNDRLFIDKAIGIVKRMISEKEKNDIEMWIAGQKNMMYQNFSEIHIRINGDFVETSRGARVPLSEAMSLFDDYKQGLDVVGRKIGHYTVSKVINGGIVIGCHTILNDKMNILQQIEPSWEDEDEEE